VSFRYSRIVVLGLGLAAPAAFAGAPTPKPAVKLNCPAGTQQWTSSEALVECVKPGKGLGTQHGPTKIYRADGTLEAEGQYAHGFKTGVWSFYDAQGRRTETIEFEGNNYHGKRVSLSPAGKPVRVEEYAKGLRHGASREYDAQGKVVREAHYEKDVLKQAK
jgi:hypothetical protein